MYCVTAALAAGPTIDMAAARTSFRRNPTLEVKPLTIIKARICLRVPTLVTAVVVPVLFLIILPNTGLSLQESLILSLSLLKAA